jgi:hypothetical protein
MHRHLTPAAAVAISAIVLPLCAATLHAGPVRINGVSFTDTTATVGAEIGFLRGAIAVLDFDNDGYMDLIFGDYGNETPHLFHNQADGPDPTQRRFVDVTTGSAFEDTDGQVRQTFGVVAADYDNDGDTDVFLTGYRPSSTSSGLLYRNEGGGNFTNVSIAAGVRRAGERAESASFVDFDLDGDLDLFIANINVSAQPFTLLENEGDGTFADATDRLPGGLPTFNSVYAHAWFDYDGDGYDDCFLVTQGDTVVLHNGDDGGERSFTDTAHLIGYTSLGPAPMGIAVGDYDNDQDFDIAVSNGAAGVYFRNDGGSFVQTALASAMWGWGINWIDAENDGDLDLFYAGSASFSMPLQFNLLFQNDGGSFTEITDALNGPAEATRYSVQLDYNNDGGIDLIAANPGPGDAPVTVYENDSDPANWLIVDPLGDGETVNRDGIGAIIRVVADGATQVRPILAGSSTTSGEDLRGHFGLGDAAEIERIEIVWPRAGSIDARTDVYEGPFAVNQILALAPLAALPGDLNGDGCVGLADLGIVLASFDIDDGGDTDGDGDTDLADLGALLADYDNDCI